MSNSMKYEFEYSQLSKTETSQFDPFIKELTQLLSTHRPVETEIEYNKFLMDLFVVIKHHEDQFTVTSPLYDKEIGPIRAKKALTESTAWGGVALKKVDVDENYVRKLLVVGKNGILGFEIHEFKHEHLEVIEGICLFIHSVHANKDWKEGKVNLSLVQRGDTITLLPGDEHGIIALTDSVVEETSTNHLDDLIFLFNSKQVM